MKFEQLPPNDKIRYAKQEFQSVVRNIFEHPEMIRNLIDSKKLTILQSKAIIKSINKLNTYECGCCRRFDATKLQFPIQKDLEPIIDIAQSNVRTKNY